MTLRALLLAAGIGLRLRPFTEKTPKCLMKIGGRPLLSYWLESLAVAGIKKILINTHHLPDQIVSFISTSPYRSIVSLVHEPELEGTAGTLRKNISFFDSEDGLLIHADNFCAEGIQNFCSAHLNRPKNCVMTMMAFRTKHPERCGILKIDQNNVVTNFFEKEQYANNGNLANGAIYALSAKFIDNFDSTFDLVSDFSTEVIPKFMGQIFTYETKNFFIDIGTPESYAEANNFHSTL